jgi:hypothetical protein
MGEVLALVQLCNVESSMISGSPPGDDDEHLTAAVRYAKEARTVADAVGWPRLRQLVLQRLMILSRVARHDDDAAAYGSELGRLAAETDEPPEEIAAGLVITAEIYAEDARKAEATETARQALALLAPLKAPGLEMRARLLIARIADEQQAPAAELKLHLERLLELCATEGADWIPLVHMWMGRMFIRDEQPGLAREHLESSLRGYTSKGDRESEAYLHELHVTVPGISARKRAQHLRAAIRLQFDLEDNAATAADMRELAAIVPHRNKEQILRAALALAQAAGAPLQEGNILTDLARVVPASAERARLQSAGTQALRRAEPVRVKVGSRLYNLLYSARGKDYLSEIERQRQAIKSAHDIVLPTVQTSNDPNLDPASYVILLWGEQIAAGRIATATPIADWKGRLARPATAAMIRWASETVGQPGLGRRITSADVEAPQMVVSREMVTTIANLTLNHRSRLDAPPQITQRALTQEERQLVEYVIAAQALTRRNLSCPCSF